MMKSCNSKAETFQDTATPMFRYHHTISHVQPTMSMIKACLINGFCTSITLLVKEQLVQVCNYLPHFLWVYNYLLWHTKATSSAVFLTV